MSASTLEKGFEILAAAKAHASEHYSPVTHREEFDLIVKAYMTGFEQAFATATEMVIEATKPSN